MNRVQRYKESAAGMGMRLLSAIPPGPCGQTVPGPPWMLAVEMDADVFDQVERCWAACEGLDLAAGETESVLSELTRLREIESNAKAAGFIGADGKVRKVLGTLPVTKDGCIVGDGSRVFFFTYSRFGGEEITLEWDVSGAGDNIPTVEFYSTREAAEAAREGNQ